MTVNILMKYFRNCLCLEEICEKFFCKSIKPHRNKTNLFAGFLQGQENIEGEYYKNIIQTLLTSLKHFASVNSKHQHPPWADSRGNFLKWSKTLPRGKIFLQKHGPRDKKISTPGEYCERSSQLFLLVGVEILEFYRNQTLKRTGRLFKSYPLVSV